MIWINNQFMIQKEILFLAEEMATMTVKCILGIKKNI